MPWFSNHRELGRYVGESVADADATSEGETASVENSLVELEWRIGHQFSRLDKDEIATSFLSSTCGCIDEDSRHEFIEGFDEGTSPPSSGFFSRFFGR